MNPLPVIADIAPILSDLDAVIAGLRAAGRDDLIPHVHAAGLALSSMLIRTELAIGEAQEAARDRDTWKASAAEWLDQLIEEKHRRFAAEGGSDWAMPLE